MIVIFLELACLTLRPSIGDAIAMARLAGFPRPKPPEYNHLQVKMDIAGLLHNMASPGQCNDAGAHSRAEEGDSRHVLPWLQ